MNLPAGFNAFAERNARDLKSLKAVAAALRAQALLSNWSGVPMMSSNCVPNTMAVHIIPVDRLCECGCGEIIPKKHRRFYSSVCKQKVLRDNLHTNGYRSHV